MTRSLLIDGSWVTGDAWIAVDNPATGEAVGRVPKLGAVETERAIAAAATAMPAWAAKAAKERADVLRRFFDLMMTHRDALAELLTREQGKPLAEARGEIAYAASFLEWFGKEAKRIYGQTIPGHAADKRIVVLKPPTGVVAAIMPWNFLAAMITRKIGPALAAGCAVVLKPASQTPFSALALGVLAEEAGLPRGLLNIVTGAAREIGATLKHHHPDAFCASLMNAQPMGFYAPAQIVRDAQAHDVQVRPPCINASRWDCTLEPTGGRYFAVRLGLRQVRGLSNADGAAIVGARSTTLFDSVEDVWRRSGVQRAAIEKLADADAFHAFGADRRQGLWKVRGLGEAPLPLFAAADRLRETISAEGIEPSVALRPLTDGREVIEDYRSLQLSLRAHPLTFVRDELARRGVTKCAELVNIRDGLVPHKWRGICSA